MTPALTPGTGDRRYFGFHRHWYYSISFIVILSFACRLYHERGWILLPDPNGYGLTEYLIDYSGGFVRRGLLGQVLAWLTGLTGLSPFVMAKGLSYAAYGAVLWIMLRQFARRRWCWWLVLSPFMCGYVHDIVRKDFILVLLLMGSLQCLRSRPAPAWLLAAALLCAALAVSLHEAYMFWGLPVVAVCLAWQSGVGATARRKWLAGIGMGAVAAWLGAQLVFKGDATAAAAVIDSWNSLLGADVLEHGRRNSIDALGWDTGATMLSHFRQNFLNAPGWGVSGLLLRPLMIAAAYYLVVNFLSAVRGDASRYSHTDRRNLSAVYVMVTVCLVPMYTVLSCDHARLAQYVALSSLATLMIMPRNAFAEMFPGWYMRCIDRLDTAMRRLLVPTRGLLAALLLTLGQSSWEFSPERDWAESVLGVGMQGVHLALRHIIHFIQ